MKPNLLFKLSGIILLINGLAAAFTSDLFLEGAGMTLDPDGITTAQAFGASLIALGITVFRIPSFVGNIKAGQHNETFLGYRTVNAQEGRLMSSATDEE